MTHPEKYAVGMLGVGMTLLGMLIGFVLLAIVCFKSYRVLPLRRSRRTYWIGMVLLIPLTLGAMPPFISLGIQTLAVIASHGWDAYAEGMRVINKHGQLSDGTFLNVFWAAAMGGWIMPLGLVLCLPIITWHMHFNPSRRPEYGVGPTGVVRLDGKPLPRAEVTFYLVAGKKLRGYIRVDTDETGKYELIGLPVRTYRITVADREATVPANYREPGRTPLEFVGDQLGPVALDLELRSAVGVEGVS